MQNRGARPEPTRSRPQPPNPLTKPYRVLRAHHDGTKMHRPGTEEAPTYRWLSQVKAEHLVRSGIVAPLEGEVQPTSLATSPGQNLMQRLIENQKRPVTVVGDPTTERSPAGPPPRKTTKET